MNLNLSKKSVLAGLLLTLACSTAFAGGHLPTADVPSAIRTCTDEAQGRQLQCTIFAADSLSVVGITSLVVRGEWFGGNGAPEVIFVHGTPSELWYLMKLDGTTQVSEINVPFPVPVTSLPGGAITVTVPSAGIDVESLAVTGVSIPQ